jgi:hypothetical protein
MKNRDQRIERLEKELLTKPNADGMWTWEEFSIIHDFLKGFEKKWPDPQAAPRFALAEYNRICEFKIFNRNGDTDDES